MGIEEDAEIDSNAGVVLFLLFGFGELVDRGEDAVLVDANVFNVDLAPFSKGRT